MDNGMKSRLWLPFCIISSLLLSTMASACPGTTLPMTIAISGFNSAIASTIGVSMCIFMRFIFEMLGTWRIFSATKMNAREKWQLFRDRSHLVFKKIISIRVLGATLIGFIILFSLIHTYGKVTVPGHAGNEWACGKAESAVDAQ